jgi:two-component system catabolic regulation response regulator CreB
MPGPLKIVVLEDEAAIADTIVYALRTEGFVPLWCATGRDGLRAIAAEAPALVVLDIGLPDMSGFDVCRELRRTSSVPIVFLTSRGAEVDRIVGLELGADDYMAKPFSPRELTARIRAILRRVPIVSESSPARESGDRSEPLATRGPWRHDSARCRLTYRGKPLELTRNEYRLLSVLVAAPGRVFSRDQLMSAAWDDPGAALDRTVDAHIKSLRARLREVAPDADPIVTHRGFGYSLREEA